MGKLHTIGRIAFRIYADDHRPAHLHVVAPDFEVMIDIATRAEMRGRLPSRDRRLVLDWVTQNHARLVAVWNDLNPGSRI